MLFSPLCLRTPGSGLLCLCMFLAPINNFAEFAFRTNINQICLSGTVLVKTEQFPTKWSWIVTSAPSLCVKAMCSFSARLFFQFSVSGPTLNFLCVPLCMILFCHSVPEFAFFKVCSFASFSDLLV